jgi:predicted nucleic-acid-binding Zn-ribbon protein
VPDLPLLKPHSDPGLTHPQKQVQGHSVGITARPEEMAEPDAALTLTPTQGGDQLKTGICPKCTSKEVFSGAGIMLKKGPFGSNAIPIGLTSIAALDNYVCTSCGYVESYISDPGKLAEIAGKWDKAGQEDNEEKEGV